MPDIDDIYHSIGWLSYWTAYPSRRKLYLWTLSSEFRQWGLPKHEDTP